MEQQNYTLEQATKKFGKPHKIFDIQIGERLYPVYSIDGYEHNLGKWNGCPDTWWLDYSVYHSDNDDEVPTIRELIPYIDTGVHRVCWEVNYRQFNSTKYKWDELSIRNGGICTIKANGKEVYKFHWRDLGGALAEAHSLINKISEHPFNFINPKEEIGRKIWYYGLPATILLGYEPGEIRINPDLSYMTLDEWWNELEKRKSNVKPPNLTQNEDDLLDAEHFAEHKDYGSINHGSVFYDGMINWFRHEKKIMNNEKMNQIISDAWANYSKKVIANNLQLIPAIDLPKTQEEFINKIKTDSEFSERWGLKIEERDVLNQVDQTNPVLIGSTALYPHKLITITYNNETIESHE